MSPEEARRLNPGDLIKRLTDGGFYIVESVDANGVATCTKAMTFQWDEESGNWRQP